MESWRILISNLQATKTKIQTTKKNKSESNEVIKSQNSWGATMDWLDVELVCRDHLNWYCQKTLVEESFIFLFLNYGGDETSKVSYFVVRQESYNCATYSNQKKWLHHESCLKKAKKVSYKNYMQNFSHFSLFFMFINIF